MTYLKTTRKFHALLTRMRINAKNTLKMSGIFYILSGKCQGYVRDIFSRNLVATLMCGVSRCMIQGCQTSANRLISADFEIFLRVLGISANQLKHRMTFLVGGAVLQDLGNFDAKKISDLFLIYLLYSFRIAEVSHFLAKHLIFISLPKGSEIHVHVLTG